MDQCIYRFIEPPQAFRFRINLTPLRYEEAATGLCFQNAVIDQLPIRFGNRVGIDRQLTSKLPDAGDWVTNLKLSNSDGSNDLVGNLPKDRHTTPRYDAKLQFLTPVLPVLPVLHEIVQIDRMRVK
jgi:hypothetical protein